MALSPVFFREKFTVPKVVWFVIVACGCLLLNAGAVYPGIGGFGLFCGAMSAVLYAVMVICNKKATNISGLENTLFQLIFACITVAIFVGVRADFHLSWVFNRIYGYGSYFSV